MIMSPTDSCSETFSSTSNSIYSHSPGLSYDRISDFRSHRVPPALKFWDPFSQPPTNMSPSVPSQATAVSVGRSDNYSGYALHRGTFPSLSALPEMSRMAPYTTTPRALEGPNERSLFGQSTNLLIDPVQRLAQPMTDAPPFHETNVIHPIISGNQTIRPEIQAKIHKGFFQVDEKWTCYRRNYFSVSCSFSLCPMPHGPLYLKFSEQSTAERILSFSMSISAIVNAQCGEPRELVQHTPKRDKQSERKPGKIVLQPCQPSPLALGHGGASSSSPHGYSLTQSAGIPMEYTSTYAGAPQPSQPPTQHTFERIQFQKATANNGKRRAQQQYYNLVVELYAEVSHPVGGTETQWFKIARRLSHPMVVRGRSPGHYKDGRRDSSTSMGPDGGSGGSGDGTGGAVLPPGIGQAARSHLTLMPYDASHRGGPQYPRTDYHQMTAADQSPLSESPHISSSSSSAFDLGLITDTMDPMDSMKSTTSIDSYQDPGYHVLNGRKPGSQYRHHLPSFDYDSITKSSDETGNGFADTYDPMVSFVPNDQHESSHYLKQPSRMAPNLFHHSTSSGYDPVYSTRASDGSPYGRFSNSQSLCA
ncbi:NDT80 / PhoG like DNA-binding family protein [Aspergillus fijiensis CBS 313.89]|uniref:PhoG like DNA-binding family protein n=1 Tax=Aspergillus fijiensis CBS 313.89 TaxID=1448319 RepID=A0A8G1RD91_9EURO|nr:PhoG like DNA-binding family protein [Aspergillus fijiensis CBS 313.89]RAK71169.1 PhoG like DNA-binding family protein [Aspergillus fijiensis CBS 313.89]